MSSASPSASSPGPSASPATAPSTCRPSRSPARSACCWRSSRSRVLAERISALLEEVGPPVRLGVARREPPARDLDPLAVPLEEEFRVGTMGLGWDADSRSIVVELLAVTEEEVDESVVLDDTEEGPDALRVFLSPVQAQGVRRRAPRRSSRPAGPPCPLCAEPLDPGRPRLRAAERVPPEVPGRGLSATLRGPSRPGRARDCSGTAAWRSPAGWSTPPTPRCSAPSTPTASQRSASTSRCAASGRSGTSRTARSPAARSPPS